MAEAEVYWKKAFKGQPSAELHGLKFFGLPLASASRASSLTFSYDFASIRIE